MLESAILLNLRRVLASDLMKDHRVQVSKADISSFSRRKKWSRVLLVEEILRFFDVEGLVFVSKNKIVVDF